MSLWIVIPVRNEEARLAEGLLHLQQAMQSYGFTDYRVLISDNGSTDATAAVLERFNREQGTSIGYLRASEVADKGLGIAQGWAQADASCSVLAYCDIDMATDPLALVQGYRLLQSGETSAVAGSRWLAASEVHGRSWQRSLISAGLSLAWRLLPQGCITDPGCGLKLVRREVWLSQSMPATRYGFAYGAELLERLNRRGFTVREIPVHWTDDDARRIRLGQATRDYAQSWWRLLCSN